MGLCLCPISKSSISMEQSFPKWILCHGVSMTGVCAMAVIEPLWEPVYEGPNNEFDGEPLLVESFSTVTIAPSRKSHGYNAHPPPLPDVQSWDAKCVMSPISPNIKPTTYQIQTPQENIMIGIFLRPTTPPMLEILELEILRPTSKPKMEILKPTSNPW